MAIAHVLPGEPIDIRTFGDALSPARSVALFKSRDLEVMRLVLPSGSGLPPHKVAGEITLQCLEGTLRVDVDGSSRPLTAGQMLYLAGDVMHAVTAAEDATALLTIVLGR